MKAHRAAACARCGNVDRRRIVADSIGSRWTIVSVVLCEDCHRHLRESDARAWEWFRKYRDRT